MGNWTGIGKISKFMNGPFTIGLYFYLWDTGLIFSKINLFSESFKGTLIMILFSVRMTDTNHHTQGKNIFKNNKGE